MKSRQLLLSLIALTALFVFGGCKGAKPPPPDPGPLVREIETVVPIVRRLRGNTLKNKDDAELRAIIERSMKAPKSIKSMKDIAESGEGVSVSEILEAAQREQRFRNRISRELNRIASEIDPSYAVDFGAAVVEAHCEGLKKELATSEPATAFDYTAYFVLALLKSGIPIPSSGQMKEVADNLARVAVDLYALTVEDEAARRAYIKAVCKIP